MRTFRLLSIIALCLVLACAVQAAGKITGTTGGNEREAAVYSAKDGLVGWTITGVTGGYEFTVEPGEYMVAVAGRLCPYVQVADGETVRVDNASNPNIGMESEVWAPSCNKCGQTYIATGTAFRGVGIWMAQGEANMKITLREDGPEGKIIGSHVSDQKHVWITDIHVPSEDFPTTPGKTYYVEIAAIDPDNRWGIGMPRLPDPYDGGIAYFDGIAHPESDLGIGIKEVIPGLVEIAGAHNDQHFIAEGPGSGACKVVGQSFVARGAKNVLTVGANCGFGGGIQYFIFTIREGGPEGKVIVSKRSRMVSDWGTTAYFQPNEVSLEEGKPYFFEYKREDGESFYSYLSSDTYAEGKAYRDGKEVEGFDQLFGIKGEIEPEGITSPYNVRVIDITDNSVTVEWLTGTKADGIVYYGEEPSIDEVAVANEDPANKHSVVLKNLKPGTVYYYRVTSDTKKEGATRMWGRMYDFMTLPVGEDKPQFNVPEKIKPTPKPGPNAVKMTNPGFEDGLKGWKTSSKAEPKNPTEYPLGDGPFGSVTTGVHGYKPYSGESMYGWYHLQVEDPDPNYPREDWKHEIVYQTIKVKPGRHYVLKAMVLTGDRGSGWGRDARVKLCVDTGGAGHLRSIDTSGNAMQTQWFATRNEWTPVSLHFTAESDTVDVGIYFLQWWAMEADYLYVDQVTVEQVKTAGA